MTRAVLSIPRRHFLRGMGVGAVAGWATRVRSAARAARPVVLNDASRLNPTPVARHVVIASPNAQDVIADLRRVLSEAAAEHRPLVIGGARHSMGGQSLCRGAFAVTNKAYFCEPDNTERSYRVSAGARWNAIVPHLDRVGFSVAVMQSNNDFSVGGTLAVNAHGWAVPYGAFASSVRSFQLMLADGTVLSCSPHENHDVFRAAIGGYGLLGIVLEAELDMVENVSLKPRLERMSAEMIGTALPSRIEGRAHVRMAYGRLSVSRSAYLSQALLVTFQQTTAPAEQLSAHDVRLFGLVSRGMLRAQVGSDLGKSVRWWAETALAPPLAPASLTRNRLLGQPVSSLGDSGPRRTDILHEYFLRPDRLSDFLAACRQIIPLHGMELLNVTLRYVTGDPVTLLAFAPAPRVAAVMLFSQPISSAAESAMRRMTERLIDEALALGGSFYLPYRLHARRDQVERAYPRLQDFLALKQRYDPANRFQNLMFDAYFAPPQ